MKISLRLLAASSAFITLAACGAKGPLYLPDKPPPKRPGIVAPAGAGAAASELGRVGRLPVVSSSAQPPAAGSVTPPAATSVMPPAAATVAAPASSQARP